MIIKESLEFAGSASSVSMTVGKNLKVLAVGDAVIAWHHEIRCIQYSLQKWPCDVSRKLGQRQVKLRSCTRIIILYENVHCKKQSKRRNADVRVKRDKASKVYRSG